MTNSVFQGRSFLAEKDFTRAELEYLIGLSAHLKDLKKRNIEHHYLAGKNIALLFEKTSTRTRAAFTTAAIDLGAHPEYLGANDIQLGKKESTEDTAKVLGRMFDGIEFRGFSQRMVEELAEFSGVPVWNGLTDEWHPTQMLADYLTVQENFGRLEGLTLVYCGDGRNNVANSLLVTGAILGVNVHIFSPKELFPEKEIVELAEGFAKESGAHILITEDADEAVKGADVLYTDVWVSMGEEDKFEERIHHSVVHFVFLRKSKVSIFCSATHFSCTQTIVCLIHIIHVVHAGIVLNNQLWVKQQQLLQCIFHGKDAANNGCAFGIDGCSSGKNFGKVLIHTACNALVLFGSALC